MKTSSADKATRLETIAPAAPTVVLRDVAWSINGHAVLDGVSLSVSKGEIVALMGLSGIGKTTILKMIAGLKSPTEGEVFVDDGGRGVEMVFQRPLLRPHMTVARNVELPARIRGHSCDVKELLATVGLNGMEARFPSQLSGGERRRLTLARALAAQSTVLLLDEPFGGVDELTREQLFTSIGPRLRQIGLAVLLVTHSFAEAAFLADRVLLLGGRPARIRHEVRMPRPQEEDSEPATDDRLFSSIRELRHLFWAAA